MISEESLVKITRALTIKDGKEEIEEIDLTDDSAEGGGEGGGEDDGKDDVECTLIEEAPSSLSEEYSLLYFPQPVLCIIFKFVPRHEITKLREVCKGFTRIINEYYTSIISNEFNYTLHPEQLEVYKHLDMYDKTPNVLINSPMGTGKTAMMLMQAMDYMHRGYRVHITILPKTITAWVDEIAKMKTLDFKSTTPDKSSIIFIHTKYPKHRDYALHSASKHNKIYITTPYYYKKLFETVSDAKKINVCMIADECHSNNTWMYGDYSKRLLFTASIEDSSSTERFFVRNGFNYRVVNAMNLIPHGTSEKRYPKLVACDILSTSDEFSYVYKGRIPRRSKLIIDYEAMFSKYSFTKLVFFANIRADDLVSVVKGLNDHYKEAGASARVDRKELAFFAFKNTNSRVLKQFKQSKLPSVLICPISSSTEGINFEMADAVVIQDMNVLSATRARQAIGRVMRLNNTNPEIKLFFTNTSTTPVSNIRSRINEYYSIHRDCPGLEKKSEVTINKILDMMEKDDVDYSKLTDLEIMLAFTQQHSQELKFEEDDLKNLTLRHIVKYSFA